jgi:hypothetical protein
MTGGTVQPAGRSGQRGGAGAGRAAGQEFAAAQALVVDAADRQIVMGVFFAHRFLLGWN